MAVHNGARYLRAAIDSMLTQTLDDLELIVVDDASSDESPDICGYCAQRDSRVVVLTNTKRQGLTRSLNLALGVARGKYLARMDADDVSLPRRLERQVDFLDSHADVGLVGSFYSEIDAGGEVRVPVVSFPVEPIVVAWRMAFENPLPHPPIVARRALLDDAGGYDPRWATAQDFDLFTRLSDITKLANCQEVLFHWRRHAASVSTMLNEEQRSNALAISGAYTSRLLGRAVPQDLIELLWRRQPRGIEEAIRFVSTAVALCRRIIAQPRWSRRERQVLRRHASRRLLYDLTPHVRRPKSWWPLLTVVTLSPSLIVEVGARWCGRSVSRDAPMPDGAL
jgi:glycosyltransferase involved in cell wall biosynthesis